MDTFPLFLQWIEGFGTALTSPGRSIGGSPFFPCTIFSNDHNSVMLFKYSRHISAGTLTAHRLTMLK